MKNTLTIILLLILMTAFTIFIHLSKISHEVTEILSPVKVAVDINNNKVKDNSEIFCSSVIEIFSRKPDE